MDVGVGSFVLAAGATSRQAREPAGRPPLTAGLRSSGPLVLLGLGRLLATKSTGYQVCAAPWLAMEKTCLSR